MKFIKPRKPRGVKLTGEPSLDMCPHCIAFHCDPMAMSPEFQNKISERRRKHLCPACEQTDGFCDCKSSLSAGRTGMKTHNNKARRAALRAVTAREQAYFEYAKHHDIIAGIIGEKAACDISHALYYHNKPAIDLSMLKKAVSGANVQIDWAKLAPAWN